MQVTSHKLHVTCCLAIGYWLLAISSLYSQQNLPLNREFNLLKGNTEGFISSSNSKSYLDTTTITACGYSLWCTPPDQYNFFSSCFKPHVVPATTNNKNLNHSLFRRKLTEENLFIVNDTTDKFHLTLDPLFNFEFGRDEKDSTGKNLYKNTRGVLLKGDIGKQFSFESSFYENQATFPAYVDEFNKTSLVVPGQGRWKPFKKTGYDFAMASGYVSYSPSKHFNFQVGTGKHFIGDGYRSLLLSDNAFNYPFARITTTFGKFQYTNLYTVFMNISTGGSTNPGIETLFQKKAGNFQFLSWNINKRIQLGFFQGLIWQASDSMNRQHLNFNYFSPVIYNAALAEGLSGTNNVLLGWTLKFKITNSISLYGQYMMDDFSTAINSLDNKTGFQVGTKYFDVFGIKNLHFQMEYNQVRPYAYASENSAQSYTHYDQPLADPLGANFKEAIAFLNYRIGDFFAEVKMNYAIIGKDSIGRNFGNNIFASDANAFYGINSSNNQMGQGAKTILQIFDFHIGYLVNPSTNFNVLIGVSNRSSISSIENSQTNYVYFGIRTSLNNVYYDF